MVDTGFLTATVIAQDLSMLPALIIFALTPKSGRKQFLLLWLALLFGFLSEATAAVGYFVFKANMNFAYNIAAVLVYPTLILFYRTQFKSKQIRSVLTVLVITFVALALINLFFIQGLQQVNSYTFSFRCFAFVVIALAYFNSLIRDLPTEAITKLPMFWINTGVLIFFAGTMFQFLLSDYMINVLKGNIVNTWTIKNFIGIAYYLIIAIGLWHNRSTYVKSSSAESQTLDAFR